MNEINIPKQALIVVVDGGKALFLRNTGGADQLKLEVEDTFAHDNPATHEQGTDKPGRTAASAGTARSAMDETDWHQLAEDRFIGEMSATLYRLAHEKKFEALVIVAPPRVLGTLRKTLHKEVVDRITGEVPKGLTSHPLPEIERLLAA